MSSPSAPLISTPAHPASVALVLTSGFYTGPQDQLLYSTTAIAAASDGSVWLSSNGLYVYGASQGGFVQASTWSTYGTTRSGFGAYIAPVNARLAYFLTTQGGATGVAQYSAGTTSAIAALPGGDVPSAITASADGMLWATGSSGKVYAYDPSAGTWATIGAPPGQLLSLSVANASTVYALTSAAGGSALYAYANGAWAHATTACPSDATWLGGCLDGSYWAAADFGLVLVLPDGTSKTFLKPADVTIIGGYTAASRYGCYFLAITKDPKLEIGIKLAGYGVTEEPAQTWPPMNADQQAAYAAINAKLNIIDPAGVRGTYTNINAPLSDYYSAVTGMANPPGVSPGDWAIVQTQISNELEYAQAVQNLFANLAVLNLEIAQIQTDEYAAVVEMAGLPDNPDQQPQTLVSIILGQLVSTLFNAAVLGAQPEVQQLVSVGESIYNFAATEEAKKHDAASRNAQLQIACADLAATLADMQTEAVTATSAFQTAILSDWGMLQACGVSIVSNVWYWPPNFDPKVLSGAGAANALTFYQTLMPAKWQIMQIETTFILGTGGTTAPPYVPTYATIYQYEESDGDALGWWQVVSDQGADPDPFTRGPFPNQALIEAIMALTNPQDFFTGTNGWHLPVATMAGYEPAPGSIGFQPWVDSAKLLGR